MSTRREFVLEGAATLLLSAPRSKSLSGRAPSKPVVPIAIVGLVHDHIRSMLPVLLKSDEVALVGIVEPNRDAAAPYVEKYKLDHIPLFSSLNELLSKKKVAGVVTYTSIAEHVRVVQSCAAAGIHVMMEKPLAISLEDGREIANTGNRAGIHVIVNYDTTFYPSMRRALELVREQKLLGDIRKIVVRHGHGGPRPPNSTQFLQSLTDPALGGGVLLDFGCYGVNLATCLLADQRPISVYAVAQSFRPDLYPMVEDEATLVLTYPKAVVIVEASWNWPHPRNDADIYGTHGELHVLDPLSLEYRQDDRSLESGDGLFQSQQVRVPTVSDPAAFELSRGFLAAATSAEALSYFATIVRAEHEPSEPSSLAVNLLVTEILSAAKESSRTGCSIRFA